MPPEGQWTIVKRNNQIKAAPDKSQGQPKGPQEEYKSDPKRVLAKGHTDIPNNPYTKLHLSKIGGSSKLHLSITGGMPLIQSKNNNKKKNGK